MNYLDRTFCASPDCKNKCGRKMTEKEKNRMPDYEQVSYAYFCGEPQWELSRKDNPENFDIDL